MGEQGEREYLIDVSRLIWRAWRGRPATGIDRVCLAYCERYARRAQAVIQRRGSVRVVSPRQSDRLFRLLLQEGSAVSKTKLAAGLIGALITVRKSPPRSGMIYFNVGHTGLDDPVLPGWLKRNAVRAIYMIHDLIPLTHPQYCRAGEQERHARRMTHALDSAAGIISNSEDTRGQLERFALSNERSMPPTVVAWLSGQTAPPSVTPVRLKRPYFVTVGTIEARKNHLMLLQVWDELVQAMGAVAPILVIIGGRGWEADDVIARLDELGPLQGSVQEVRACNDGVLAAWIAGARALLMPSFVEGFGLPVIEALQLGTPVIASDLPVHHDIVGDKPTYLDPNDVEAWTEAISDFTADGAERRRQVAAIQGYRGPTWDEHFRVAEAWLADLDSAAF